MLYTADKKRMHVNMDHLIPHHNDVVSYLQEAVGRVYAERWPIGNVVKVAVDMGRVVGKTICVRTTEDDEIIYAKRIGRLTTSRFVKNRDPEDCQYVTLIFKNFMSECKLITAYIGNLAEKEIDDPSIRTQEELDRSEKFWSEHALIWGRQVIRKNST